MSKGSRRLSAPWVGAALLGAGVVTTGACGSIAENDLFDSGASSGAAGTGGAATMSTSSTMSTTATSSGQGGDATSTSGSTGGAGGSGGGETTSSTTTSSTTASSTTASSSTGGGVCGNGVREAGEQCDKTDFGPLTCASFDFSNPAGLACHGDCTVDSSGCKATCDGQKVEVGEVCEGTLLNGHSCLEIGYSNADGLKCVACQLDSSGCKAKCGDGKVEPTEQCDDSNTMPGDGCDATCQTEVITTGGLTCATAIPVSVGLGTQDVMGTTANGGSHTAQACTAAAKDRVYAVTATANGFLTANLVRSQTSFDSVLYIGTACTDANANTTLLCNDSRDPQNQTVLKGGEVVSIRVQQNQTYYLFVDGFNATDSGTYQLHLDLSSGLDCNDPVPIPLEAGTAMGVRGSTTNISAFPNVQGTCGGQPGGQVVYAVTRAVSGPLGVDTVTANTNYNAVLYARSTCSQTGTELDCSNNDGTAAESMSIGNVNAGVATYVYVDGSIAGGSTPSGNYGLKLTP